MHNYLIVLEIPIRWYSRGDALCAAVGQAELRWRSREEGIWSGDRDELGTEVWGVRGVDRV